MLSLLNYCGDKGKVLSTCCTHGTCIWGTCTSGLNPSYATGKCGYWWKAITQVMFTLHRGYPRHCAGTPVLFLCHINDFPESVSSQVRLFAYDCLLYRPIKTHKDHITLQNDLNNLEKWTSTWGMRFNVTKCYILSVKKSTTYLYRLTVCETKFCGIIDQSLFYIDLTVHYIQHFENFT